MTAIVAVLGTGREEGRRAATQLLSAMAHRGATEVMHADDGVTLAVRGDAVGNCAWFGAHTKAIVDARIDNREELAELLSAPHGVGDAELIARASTHFGDLWPKHVRGDFAAIVWRSDRRLLTVARDRVGVRWLYWTAQGGVLRCASEMPALMRSMEQVTPSRLQMAMYLADRYDEREATLVERLAAVPPAHVIGLGRTGEVSRVRYWHAYNGKSLHLDRRVAAASLRDALTQAVSQRLQGADPVSTHLSGGLDSTTITALTARVLRARGALARLRPVSIVFPGLECDERIFSRAVASFLGLTVEEVDPLTRPDLLTDQYAPHADGSVYYHPTVAMLWSQLEATRRLGARTVLTGLGSDHAVHREPHAEALSEPLRKSLGPPINPKGIVRALLDRARPGSSRWIERELLGRRSGLARKLARDVDDACEARLAALRARPHRDAVHLHLLACVEHDILVPLASLDRMGSRTETSFAHPFLDERVLELLFALPHAVAAGTGNELKKPLLRESMRGQLPAEVLDRRTITEFNPFIRKVLELERPAMHLLSRGLVVQAGLFDESVIAETIGNLAPAVHLRTVVQWLGLEVWLRSLESGEKHG